jgi:hypothetical protein
MPESPSPLPSPFASVFRTPPSSSPTHSYGTSGSTSWPIYNQLGCTQEDTSPFVRELKRKVVMLILCLFLSLLNCVQAERVKFQNEKDSEASNSSSRPAKRQRTLRSDSVTCEESDGGVLSIVQEEYRRRIQFEEEMRVLLLNISNEMRLLRDEIASSNSLHLSQPS